MFFDFKKVSLNVRARSKFAQTHADKVASGRRAINLIPEAIGDTIREVKDTISLRFHHLLINLEGTERSACLKITSERQKSRSAILLYRGRVVGSVYGRKHMKAQYLSQDAHKCALSDLAIPGNVVDAYELPEDLVLAAAAMFSGQQLNLDESRPLAARLEQAGTSLVQANVPGCIVITNNGEVMVGLIYICGGRIVGVYSSQNSWQQPNLANARRLLSEQGAARIYAAVLPLQEGAPIGFSLTGLGDRRREVQSSTPYLREFGENLVRQLDMASARKPGGATISRMAAKHNPGRRTQERSTFAISPQ